MESASGAVTGIEAAPGNVLATPVCFVHIPKTAGATLETVLRRAYSDDGIVNAGNWLREEARAQEKVRRMGQKPKKVAGRIVVGHVPYGVFRPALEDRVRYMTLLREPVERVLSHYYRHLHGKSHAGAELESLAQALKLGLAPVTNLSTRMLCDDPHGVPVAESLNEAKRNLQQFLFVGLQERFDESIILLHRALGLADIHRYGPLRHVTANRPRAEALSETERRMVLEYNALDAELYAFAGALFDEQLAKAGTGIEEDVERLRALCAPVLAEQAAERRQAASWLERELPRDTTRPVPQLYAAAAADGIARAALREEILRLRETGKAVVVVLDNDSYFLSTESRFLESAIGSVVHIASGSEAAAAVRLAAAPLAAESDSRR